MVKLRHIVRVFLTMNDPIIDKIRGMTIFVRVVDAGSFSEAGRRLGVSRAVVSYQIKQF